MVEILRIEKVVNGTKVSDFVNITFRTDLGITGVTRYPIQNVEDTAAMKQFVYEKATYLDKREGFTSTDKEIPITKDEWVKLPPQPTPEDIFIQEAMILSKWKEYYDLGLMTETQYDAKVSEVLKLVPAGYFDIKISKE